MKRIQYELIMLMVLCTCVMTSCGNEKSNGIQKGRDILYVPTTSAEETTTDDVDYDVKDKAVVLNVDTDNMQVVLKSMQDGEKYILTYTGACDVTDKYGDIIAMSRINIGEIVDAYYINTDNKLTRLHISDDTFEYKKITDFQCDTDNKVIIIKDTKYTYDENIVVTSGGRDIDISEIAGVDEVTVKGKGKKVESVIVTSGHGYIKLGSVDYFEGGIIEIGQKQMLLITKDMLITAPEGTYNITATINGKGGTKEVTVKRDEELRVNLTDFQEDAVRYGSYSFDITPQGAVLLVDNKKTDYSGLVELSYGSHTVRVTADGYESYNGTILVDSVFDSLTIDLTADETTEGESTTENEDGKYLIYVDEPEEVQVYFDGSYKGVSPVSFEKVSGTHVITLRRDGYETKMYTFGVTSEQKDVHYVLPELVEVKAEG